MLRALERPRLARAVGGVATTVTGSRSAGHDAVSNLANVSGKTVASYTAASSVRR